MSRRPKIVLESEPLDQLLDRISMVLLLLLFLIPLFSFSGLPESIPQRFGQDGSVTSTGSRITIWILPFTGLFIFVMMYLLNKAPHQFNYPVKITEENARFHYRKATRLMRIINMICMLMFVFITWSVIDSAHTGSGLNTLIMMLLLVGLFVPIIWYLYLVMRKKTEPDTDGGQSL